MENDKHRNVQASLGIAASISSIRDKFEKQSELAKTLTDEIVDSASDASPEGIDFKTTNLKDILKLLTQMEEDVEIAKKLASITPSINPRTFPQ